MGEGVSFKRTLAFVYNIKIQFYKTLQAVRFSFAKHHENKIDNLYKFPLYHENNFTYGVAKRIYFILNELSAFGKCSPYG